MWVEPLLKVSQGLLTPLIAVLAVYIAWQQWKTNRQKLIWEQYDRRLTVYEEVRKVLSIIVRDADISTDDLMDFRTAVAEADFLFGPEIPEYIDVIYKRGVKLRYWNQQYRDYTQEKPGGYDHEKVVNEMHAELEWLTGQFEPAKEKFRKYLDVSQ